MSKQTGLFTIRWGKSGHIKFEVDGALADLTYDQMNDFRKMLVVGIGVAEDFWRTNRKDMPVAVQAEFPAPPTPDEVTPGVSGAALDESV